MNMIVVHRPDGIVVDVPYNPEDIGKAEFAEAMRDTVMLALTFIMPDEGPEDPEPPVIP